MAASSEIEKLERRYAENPDGRYFAPLADAYRKAGQADRALEVVRAGLEKQPDYLSAHIVLGRCLLDKHDDEGAGQAFERVLGLDAENIIALKSLSEIAERRGEPVSARQWLQKLLKVDPMNADAEADLQRLGGAIAEAPTEPMESLPADLGSERSSEFSFADVALPEPEATVLPEPAGVADLALEPMPSDAPGQVESAVPGMIAVQFAPPEEAVPPPPPDIKPFDESLAWGTGERSSRSVSQHDLEMALQEHDQDVVDSSQALEMATHAAESSGAAVFELDASPPVEPPAAPVVEAPAAAEPEVVGDAWSGRASLQTKAPHLGEFEIIHGEPELWSAAAHQPGAPAPLPEFTADAEAMAGLSDLPIIMPEDVTPPEEMAHPSAKQQRASVEALPDIAGVSDEGLAEPEAPPLVTETMGDLYLQQGFRNEAAEVYRNVLAQRPDNAGVRAKLAALLAPPPSLSAKALGGESVRTWLRRVALARVAGPGPAPTAVVPAGPSPLEEAFAQPEPTAEPVGEPTHQARDAFTLDAIFGGPAGGSAPQREPEAAPPAPPVVPAGTSFDEFFGSPLDQASVRPDAAAPPAPPPEADDIGSFNAWLHGLKR